jgi:hypothetical protein
MHREVVGDFLSASKGYSKMLWEMPKEYWNLLSKDYIIVHGGT